MKRNDLLKLIESYPEDTEFFIIGQGINEGTPLKKIVAETFETYFVESLELNIDTMSEEEIKFYGIESYGNKRTDVMLNAYVE